MVLVHKHGCGIYGVRPLVAWLCSFMLVKEARART